MPRGTVASVVEYDVSDREVSLNCRVQIDDGEASPEDTVTLDDRIVPVTIQFVTPEIFRFELDGAPDVPSGRGTLDLSPEAIRSPVELKATETDDGLVIHTDRLTIEIGLDSWFFLVRDRDGKRLLEEQRGDVSAKSERRVNPLGYELERTNRWPYRRTSAGTSFVLGADEYLYGLGETFTAFEKRGETVDCWVTQPNGAETADAYKSVPFYLSTAGYGLLVDSDQHVQFDLGETSAVSSQLTVDDDLFAFVFIGGPAFKDILERYTALTGRPGAVPRWSHGIWYSRMAYEDRQTVESVLDTADAADLPVDVIHLDPAWLDGLCTLEWDTEAFPEPAEFIQELHDRGVRLSLWEYPYLLTDTDAFEEAAAKGYLVEDGTGVPYILERLSWSSDRGAIIDFTNSEARAWWADRHESLVEQGVDVFKCDFGEYLPPDAVLDDGSTGRTARNRYPQLYAQTVHDGIQAAGGDPLLWVRAGWAGGQQYPVHWGGDPASSFEAMGASIRGGLSLGLSGYGFWAADIGGFHGTPSSKLYVRWAQFALLANSHARFHGTTPREPWHFGDEAIDIIRQYCEERYRLLPYFWTLARIATTRGLPVMRPLVLEFQDDHGARTCDDQVMLGPALLVAPICSPTGTRAVYLPPGEWVDYWSGDRFSGGQTLQVDPGLEEIPAYLRAGRIHPRTSLELAAPDSLPEELILRGSLADGAAEGEVLDPETDSLCSVSFTQAEGKLHIDAPLSIPVTAEVVAIQTVPDTVSMNGIELAQVATNPNRGEWQIDEDKDVLIAVGPQET